MVSFYTSNKIQISYTDLPRPTWPNFRLPVECHLYYALPLRPPLQSCWSDFPWTHCAFAYTMPYLWNALPLILHSSLLLISQASVHRCSPHSGLSKIPFDCYFLHHHPQSLSIPIACLIFPIACITVWNNVVHECIGFLVCLSLFTPMWSPRELGPCLVHCFVRRA